MDCIASLAEDQQEVLPPVQSTGALVFRGVGTLDLQGGYRFAGGTRVEGGVLRVSSMPGAPGLVSNVHVGPQGRLAVFGDVRGNVDNHGAVDLWETVHGDLANAGTVYAPGMHYGTSMRIGGDVSQSAEGTLEFALLPPEWEQIAAPLHVDGQARLASTRALLPYADAWGPYAPPAIGTHWILHAERGISGRFDTWEARSMFIEGTPRYEAQDLWLYLTHVELDQAMQAGGASPLAVAAAANVQAALDGAPGLLGPIAPLLWLDDPRRAERAFESLAGHAHAGLEARLHWHLAAAGRLDAQLARLSHAPQPLAWSAAGPGTPGILAGSGPWLGPRLLAGVAAAHGPAHLPFAAGGGVAWGRTSLAAAHLHYRGDAWHATTQLGAGRTWLQLQRPLDTGDGRPHLARSRRAAAQAFAHVQLARDMPLGGGRLQPLASLDYSRIDGEAFAELGDTGLELVGEASRRSRLAAALGARYSRHWRRLWLELEAQRHQALQAAAPVHAGFRAAPAVRFRLPDLQPRGGATLGLRLGGPLEHRWEWDLACLREDGRFEARPGLARGF